MCLVFQRHLLDGEKLHRVPPLPPVFIQNFYHSSLGSVKNGKEVQGKRERERLDCGFGWAHGRPPPRPAPPAPRTHSTAFFLLLLFFSFSLLVRLRITLPKLASSSSAHYLGLAFKKTPRSRRVTWTLRCHATPGGEWNSTPSKWSYNYGDD